MPVGKILRPTASVLEDLVMRLNNQLSYSRKLHFGALSLGQT